MAGAIIVIDQPGGAGSGSPGVARNDLWQSKQVNLSCAVVNSGYQWDLLDVPPGSGAALVGEGTSTPHFLPDLIGSYRVQLTTNGGGPSNVQILVMRVRNSSTGVLVNRGWAPPAFGEQSGESNYDGNTRGWAENIEYILTDVNAVLSNVLPVPDGGDVGKILTATADGEAAWVDAGALATISELVDGATTVLSVGAEASLGGAPVAYLGVPGDPTGLLFLDGVSTAFVGYLPRASAGNGASLELYAQTATSGTGGSLSISTGDGSVAPGVMHFVVGVKEFIQITSSVLRLGELATAAINIQGPTGTTVGTAGAASALPATPDKYLEILVNNQPYLLALWKKP